MTRGAGLAPAAARPILALAVLALAATARVETARAQTGGEVADSVFVEKPREPVSYSTSYDRNVSGAEWTQTLSYSHSSDRAAFSTNANLSNFHGLQGLETDVRAGDISGRLNLRATNRWIWTLDGRFNMSSNGDNRSSTNRRQNQLQIRTQYSANPWPSLSGVGVLFTEFQQEQSILNGLVPRDTLRVPVDTTVVPPVENVYTAHVSRDSAYTSGRRDGFSGSATWKPATWIETKGSAVATRIRPITQTLRRDYWAANLGDPATVIRPSRTRSESPNGDQRYETQATYTGLPRTKMLVLLKDQSGDQAYYVLAQGAQEHVSSASRSASYHAEHNLRLPGAMVTVDAALGRTLRQYTHQPKYGSLVNSRSIAASFALYQEGIRGTLGFQAGRTRNDQPPSQSLINQPRTGTGSIIDRSVNVGGAKRVMPRLWLDAAGSITLYSRVYDDRKSDQDDVKGYVNAGGGYLISPRCSTAVHFSTNRTHKVAIDASASGGNYVLTSYQMDALMTLQLSRSFRITQNYLVNANYQIYDYDEGPRNSLTRIRRIDTTLSDSLFSFGFIRLTHNFSFQDLGSFTRIAVDQERRYSVVQELYRQNVGVTLGICPVRGITFSVTQALANTRFLYPNPAANATTNRWDLNLGVVVNRELPGDMTLNGSVQHIGAYTERPGVPPPDDVVEYWLAGVAFTKDF